jgi:hypothetical protein
MRSPVRVGVRMGRLRSPPRGGDLRRQRRIGDGTLRESPGGNRVGCTNPKRPGPRGGGEDRRASVRGFNPGLGIFSLPGVLDAVPVTLPEDPP